MFGAIKKLTLIVSLSAFAEIIKEPVDLPGYDPLGGSLRGFSKNGLWFWQINLEQNAMDIWKIQGTKGQKVSQILSLPHELQQEASILSEGETILNSFIDALAPPHAERIYFLNNSTKPDKLKWDSYSIETLYKASIYAASEGLIAFSPLASQGQGLEVWDTKQNRLLLKKSFPSILTHMAFSPNGQKIAVKVWVEQGAHKDQAWLYVIDIQTGLVKELLYDQNLNEDLPQKHPLVWSQDGTQVGTRGVFVFVIWEVNSGDILYNNFSPPLSRATAGGDFVSIPCGRLPDYKSCLWRVSRKKVEQTFIFSENNWLTPDGLYFLQADFNSSETGKVEEMVIYPSKTTDWKTCGLMVIEGTSFQDLVFIQKPGKMPLFYMLVDGRVGLFGWKDQ